MECIISSFTIKVIFMKYLSEVGMDRTQYFRYLNKNHACYRIVSGYIELHI